MSGFAVASTSTAAGAQPSDVSPCSEQGDGVGGDPRRSQAATGALDKSTPSIIWGEGDLVKRILIGVRLDRPDA